MGGSTYAWSNVRIIALLVLAGVLLIGFIAVQFWKGDSATVPPRIIKQRSVAAGFYYALCSGAAMMTIIYFLATWFQAIQGVSAYESGIRLLPLVLALVVGSVSGGIFTTKVGYFAAPLILGVVIMSTGAGLLTTLAVHTSRAKWIGYQVVYGLGLGLGMQMPSMAAQTVLNRHDVPIGASLMFFAQWLGGAVFVSVGQNVLSKPPRAGPAQPAQLQHCLDHQHGRHGPALRRARRRARPRARRLQRCPGARLRRRRRHVVCRCLRRRLHGVAEHQDRAPGQGGLIGGRVISTSTCSEHGSILDAICCGLCEPFLQWLWLRRGWRGTMHRAAPCSLLHSAMILPTFLP